MDGGDKFAWEEGKQKPIFHLLSRVLYERKKEGDKLDLNVKKPWSDDTVLKMIAWSASWLLVCTMWTRKSVLKMYSCQIARRNRTIKSRDICEAMSGASSILGLRKCLALKRASADTIIHEFKTHELQHIHRRLTISRPDPPNQETRECIFKYIQERLTGDFVAFKL